MRARSAWDFNEFKEVVQAYLEHTKYTSAGCINQQIPETIENIFRGIDYVIQALEELESEQRIILIEDDFQEKYRTLPEGIIPCRNGKMKLYA